MVLQPEADCLVSDIFPAKRKPNMTPQVSKIDTLLSVTLEGARLQPPHTTSIPFLLDVASQLSQLLWWQLFWSKKDTKVISRNKQVALSLRHSDIRNDSK